MHHHLKCFDFLKGLVKNKKTKKIINFAEYKIYRNKYNQNKLARTVVLEVFKAIALKH